MMPPDPDEYEEASDAPDVKEEHASEIAKQGTNENPGVLPRPIW